MATLEQHLKQKLDALEAQNQLRRLSVPEAGLIDFTSNDYLGLARNPALAQMIEQKMRSLSPFFVGATGSRLLSGNSEYTELIEKKLARIFNGESALIFNSGYNANLGVLSSVPQRNEVIFYDELVHASIKDGVRLSLAARFPFKHNDLDDLEAKLKRSNHDKKYIVVESIYSMTGDQVPLTDYITLAERYDASIIVDEAHSTGVFGKSGNGLANSLAIQDKIDIRIYTFGKAMGTHGACVVGSKTLVQYLINNARPFIYTTALPPHTMASIDCALDFLEANISLQKNLSEKINVFQKSITSTNRLKSSSAIQCILFEGNDNVRKAARFLQENNFDVRPILSPTVPKGSERLRICLHTYNSESEVRSLTKALGEVEAKVNQSAR
jgi:8-amino-7-oxononanoate synthase